MSLTAKVIASITGTETAARDLGSASTPLSLVHTVNFASGTGNGQADLFWDDTRQLAASGTEDLDLVGALTRALGGTLSLAKLKAILVVAASGNTNNVEIGGGNTTVPLFDDVSDIIGVRPGGCFLWVAPNTGITLTAGSADLLTVTNSAGSTTVDYSIMVLGTSA